MPPSDPPQRISSLEDAKAYFQCMGCSGFHMFREDEELYRQYEALSISTELEKAWRLESISKYLDLLEAEDGDAGELWAIHSSVVDLILASRSVHSLERLLDATRHSAHRASKFHRLLMGETMVRDQLQRPSLILFALDSGVPQLTGELVALARELSSTPFTPEDEAEHPWKELRGDLESRRLKLISDLDAAITTSS